MKKTLGIITCSLLVLLGSFSYVYADFTYSASVKSTSCTTAFCDTANINLISSGGHNKGSFLAFKPQSPFAICAVTVYAQVPSGYTNDYLAMKIGVGTTSYPTAFSQYLQDQVYSAQTSFGFATSSGSGNRPLTYTFSPCVQVQGNQWYSFYFYRTPTDFDLSHTINIVTGSTLVSTTTGFSDFRCDLIYQGGFQGSSCASLGIQGLTINAVVNYSSSTAATSTSSFDVDSSHAYCDGAFPPGGVLNITNNLCLAAGYLFIPSNDSLNSFGNLSNVLVAKVPFSYISDIWNAMNGLQPIASTSQNFQGIVIDFPSAHVATSTLVVLPSVTFLSASTVRTYLSDSTWGLLKSLMAVALYLSLALNIFFTARNLPR